MEDKALGLLGLMRRARAVEPGTDNACDAVRDGKAKLLILSADINDNARRKAENVSNGRRVLLQSVHYTRSELAAAFGLADCSMAAVTDIGFANALAKLLAEADPRRYGELSPPGGSPSGRTELRFTARQREPRGYPGSCCPRPGRSTGLR